jgi:hypothetical protein
MSPLAKSSLIVEKNLKGVQTMRMKNLVIGLVVGGACLAAASIAQATLFTNLAILNGSVNTFEDNSRGLIIDRDSSGTVSVGDVVMGIARFDRRINPTTGQLGLNEQLAFVYSYQVKSLTPAGPFFTVQYQPLAAADALSLPTLLAGNTTATAPLASMSAFQKDHMMFAMLEQTTAYDPASDSVNPGMTVLKDVLGAGTGPLGGTAGPWLLDALGGMNVANGLLPVDPGSTISPGPVPLPVGVPVLPGAGQAYYASNLITGGPGISLPLIDAADNTVPIGQASSGEDWFYLNLPGFGSNILYGTNVFDVTGTDVTNNFQGWSELSVTGANIFGVAGTNWLFSDKADVNFRVLAPGTVPEPMTASLGFMALAGLALAAYRRRAA